MIKHKFPPFIYNLDFIWNFELPNISQISHCALTAMHIYVYYCVCLCHSTTYKEKILLTSSAKSYVSLYFLVSKLVLRARQAEAPLRFQDNRTIVQFKKCGADTKLGKSIK